MGHNYALSTVVVSLGASVTDTGNGVDSLVLLWLNDLRVAVWVSSGN
ncbi:MULTISPECIES: hypothetical protein [Trichocoleus]|uniref:Uncharacterized protein n=1 Tax=Trichocoleus desertorum GB2-A4 TaxID=2933944 RepID=A0ABV0J2Y4_9CYAN|nr:hypothetical protein [Trichocoleus sp. FACHB-46]MBD1860740.1 hypothetical protein [Trichocoleus sp. FACHB-46]